MQKVYAEGLYFNHKHPNAPEFVIGSLLVQKDRFIDWIVAQEEDEKGYIRLQIKEGREKPYIELDTYKRN